MTFLAIDPGSTESAFVEFGRVIVDNSRDGAGPWFDGMGPRKFGIWPNGQLLSSLRRIEVEFPEVDALVIEWMQPRGMPTSAEEFETMYNVGRFAEAANHLPLTRLTRLRVKMHICGRVSATDSNVRAALIDRYGGVGGKRVAVGLKAAQGPLYGVTGDVWAALAVAVTYSEGIR